VKPSIEIDPSLIVQLLAGISELARESSPSSLNRMFQMLEIGLGLRTAGYANADYAPQALTIPGLKARPFHDPSSVLPHLASTLREALPAIRREALHISPERHLFASFLEQSDDGHAGDMAAGARQEAFLHGGNSAENDGLVARKCPLTLSVLESLCGFVTGDASFSVLWPGNTIPARYGESNARLTVHLPLVVKGDCGLEVGGERRTVREGECIVLDDGFLHRAWNHSTHPRIHLIFTIWNPELTMVERTAVELVRKTFRRSPRVEGTPQMLKLLVDDRIARHGRVPAGAEDVSSKALARGLASLQSGLDALQRAPKVSSLLTLLELYRREGLFPRLEWEKPHGRSPLRDDQQVVCRDRRDFMLVDVEDSDYDGTLVIEFREKQLEVKRPFVPLFRRVVDGRPFRVADLAREFPPGESRGAIKAFFDLLWNEGLLISAEDS